METLDKYGSTNMTKSRKTKSLYYLSNLHWWCSSFSDNFIFQSYQFFQLRVFFKPISNASVSYKIMRSVQSVNKMLTVIIMWIQTVRSFKKCFGVRINISTIIFRFFLFLSFDTNFFTIRYQQFWSSSIFTLNIETKILTTKLPQRSCIACTWHVEYSQDRMKGDWNLSRAWNTLKIITGNSTNPKTSPSKNIYETKLKEAL